MSYSNADYNARSAKSANTPEEGVKKLADALVELIQQVKRDISKIEGEISRLK